MPLGMAACSCAQYDLAGHTDGTPPTPISCSCAQYDLVGQTDGTLATPSSSQPESRLISCRSPAQQSAISEQPAFRKLHTTHLPSSPHTVVEVSLLSPYAAPASLRIGSHTGQPLFASATALTLSTRPCLSKGQVQSRFLRRNSSSRTHSNY